jgi:hypothetical protein
VVGTSRHKTKPRVGHGVLEKQAYNRLYSVIEGIWRIPSISSPAVLYSWREVVIQRSWIGLLVSLAGGCGVQV